MTEQEKIDDFIDWSEKLAKNKSQKEAFKLISTKIDECDDRYLNDYIPALNFIRSEEVLNWIERNAPRVENVSENWGHLAASSHFNWKKAEEWLSKGRPLSLIALDALLLCTTIGERLNQSLWMREINPSLKDNPRPDIIARRLQDYLIIDKVPRTRKAVEKIITNIFLVD